MQIKTQQLNWRNKHRTWDRLGGNDMSRIMIDDGNTVINLNIQQMVTMIGGDSGTGKTFVQTMVSNLNHGSGALNKGLPDKIYVVSEWVNLYYVIDQHPDKALIIVDRIEDFQDDALKDLVSEINKCNNTWILLGRIPLSNLDDKVNFNRFGCKVLKHKSMNNKTVIYDELV